MKTIDSRRAIGNRGAHEPPKPPGSVVRVSRFREWSKRVFRVTPSQRAEIVEIAQALHVTSDGAVRLALRHYAAKRGHDLPGWQPIVCARIMAFDVADVRDRPRAWFHYRASWLPVFEALYHDECGTLAGVLRAAITEFHRAGAEVWRAAMSTPPARPASTAGTAAK